LTSPTHRPEAATATIRMAALPQLRHWIAVPLTATVLIVAAGLALRFVPGVTAADMSVDAELSHDHTAPLTGVALFINVVFSPAGGVAALPGEAGPGSGAAGLKLLP